MAALAPVGRLEEAAEDLRRWERKLRSAQDRLADKSEAMAWKGRGAEDFRGRVKSRTRELDVAADALRRAHRALDTAADDVRVHRRRVEAAEQAWSVLQKQKLAPATTPTPPPPAGDASWPTWLQTATGGAA